MKCMIDAIKLIETNIMYFLSAVLFRYLLHRIRAEYIKLNTEIKKLKKDKKILSYISDIALVTGFE